MHWDELVRIAQRELEEEERRKKIEQIKNELRKKVQIPWWKKLLSYRVKFYSVEQ